MSNSSNSVNETEIYNGRRSVVFTKSENHQIGLTAGSYPSSQRSQPISFSFQIFSSVEL